MVALKNIHHPIPLYWINKWKIDDLIKELLPLRGSIANEFL